MMVAAAILFAGVSEAGAATSGLAYTEDTVFTVFEDSVQVETTVTMSNTTSERRSGNTIYYSYFDRFQHVVPIGATNVVISSRGSQLRATSEQFDDDFDLVTASLPTQLRSGHSRTIDVSFVLPAGTIRSEGIFFSNPAFHSFPVWSFSDPGSGSLQLRVPDGAELGQFGGALQVTGSEDGFTTWEPTDFSVPEEIFLFVTVTVDDALVEEEFSVSGQDIVLRTWPCDDVWATFARDAIESGLPTLESLIGLPIPDQQSLEVTESVTPYFYGYAGWYDPAETTIEVGNELDDSVMLHELSHAWFNNDLFDERWVNEGLAEEFTWLAQRELGWPVEVPPSTPRSTDSGAIALVEWSNGLRVTLGDAEIRETEEYGYATSWYTLHALVEIIGVDGMRDVLAAVDSDTVSYLGDDPNETTPMPDDWRRLLDLASQTVAPRDLDAEVALEQLFIDFVLRDDDLAGLEQRREARALYREFIGRQPNWRVPGDVRTALTLWDFESATTVLGDANEVLDRHLEVQQEAETQDVKLSNSARLAYELENPNFERAMAVLDAQAEALPAMAQLRQTFARPLTKNQRWGIGDVDLAPLVVHGELAYSLDDFGEIEAARLDMEATLDAAEARGAERILWSQVGAGAMAGLALLGLWALYRIRRGRRLASGIDFTREDVVLSA